MLCQIAPELAKALLEYRDGCNPTEQDLLVFWSLDRLTREGTLATLKYLEKLGSYGIRWRSLTKEWINAGPFRDVVISLPASLAKQERVRIQERVQAGLERARVKGTKPGRAIGRPKVVFDRERARQLRREGKSWDAITRELGKNVTAIRRACREDPLHCQLCQNFREQFPMASETNKRDKPSPEPLSKLDSLTRRRTSSAPPLRPFPQR